VPEVRLIGADGEQVGIVPTAEALQQAVQAGMDLVEIAPNSEPPVCRLMDFGKFRYEESKKRHAAKKKQKQTQIKEIKFRPRTDIGDYNVKIRNLIKFLENGGEMAHQELGLELLKRVETDLSAVGTVEQYPRMEGRQMVMVVSPKKK